MELKKAFKHTSLGEIPIDWEEIEIGQIIDLLTGFPFPSSKYSESGIRLLRGSNVKRGKTDWSDDITQFWPEATSELLKYKLKEGDIVIAMDGSLVGRSFARISKSDIPSLLLQRVARIRTEKIDAGYLKELVCSDYFTKHCDNVKTSSAIPHISPKDIRDFKIPVPPTKAEQTAIATALSDMDNLIAGLEKLIEKKKAIKQGAMQELLRPKEGWVVNSPLGNILYVQGGYAFKSGLFKDIGIPIIRISDVGDGVVSLLNCVKYDDIGLPEAFCASKGDVLIAMSGATTGKIGIYTESKTAYINQRVGKFCVHDKRKNAIQFVSHLVQSHKFRIGLLKELAQGAQPNISGKQIESILVDYPSSKEEQIEIATTLSDIENEIMLMEKNLSKYQQLKQGMMQELLTGKTRLV